MRTTVLLAWVAFLAAVIVQPGETGSSDTARRLQTTRWLWTSAPAVMPGDYPVFGLVGRNHRIYPWYGIGQSLVMLPPDMIAAALTRVVPRLGKSDGLNGLVVSYIVSPLISVLTILVAFHFLGLLGFKENEAIVGALALLLGTTFLHYTQNMMENNLMLLLTITGFCFQYQWLRTGSMPALIGGSLALSASLLVRLTTGLNIIAAGCFIAICLLAKGWEHAAPRIKRYLTVLLPCSAFFLAIDRAYHYYRFGECCTTYIQIYARQQHLLNPTLPASYPYTTPFWEGFWGALLAPEKSIFLFDPLLIVLAILVFVAWKQFGAEIRAYVVSLAVILIAYIGFHARFDFWSGDVAWGDRYVTTPVQLLALVAMPLLFRLRAKLSGVIWKTGLVIFAAAIAIQFASVALWYPLEYSQMKTLGHPTFVIGLRFENMAAMAMGKMADWHLTNYLTDANVRSSVPYLYPFLLVRRHPDVSSRSITMLMSAWAVLVAVFTASLLAIAARARTAEPASRDELILKEGAQVG